MGLTAGPPLPAAAGSSDSVASEECPESTATEMPDLGIHHLKDLVEPEHVIELRHPKLPIVERPMSGVR